MTRTRWLALTAATMLVTACGAGDDTADADSATAQDAATAATGDPEDDTEDDTEDEEAQVGEDDRQEHDDPQRRLVVAEDESGGVLLVDLDAWEVTTTLDLGGPVVTHGAALTEDRRFLLLPHEDAVSVVDGGVWSSRHGDHAHHYSADPTVVGRIEGPKPSHLVSAGGRSALYFDGSGEAHLLDDQALRDGDAAPVATVTTGEPHHGFAIPLGDELLVTVPTPDMVDMPDRVGVADEDGIVSDEFTCTKTHGEAVLDGGAAAACEDGVLMVTAAGERWDATHVPYPDVDDVDPYEYGPARAWVLAAPDGVDWLTAPLGARHVLRVDPAAGTAEAFDLDQDVAMFGLAADGEGRLIVLTTDGALQALDPEDGTVLARREVIPPFEEGDPGRPFHRLVRSGDHLYVTDPTTDTVTEVATADLTVTRTLELDLTPGFLGVLGG
ncbi:hypothetical protein [Nitriliruptor alkaliphilus]|uniref:hypothetical protein n=1 Tax=Nitriliruptor alkaliphilus TaxID=427918 RepID=UPI0006985CA6|nr:hypothetical protein [Nitriliruptor alkaliphilus]